MASRMLIIDDNEETLLSLGYALKREGFEVDSARDGQEGYTKALEFKPDAIILDIMMPVMDGLTMNRHLKENPETANIPVIIITAKDDSDPEEEKNAQVSAFMRKPFTYRDLLSKIKEILEKKTS